MAATTVPGEAIEVISALLRESGTSGAAIALRVTDGPVAQAGIGSARLSGDAPMTANSRFSL